MNEGGVALDTIVEKGQDEVARGEICFGSSALLPVSTAGTVDRLSDSERLRRTEWRNGEELYLAGGGVGWGDADGCFPGTCSVLSRMEKFHKSITIATLRGLRCWFNSSITHSRTYQA